MNSAGGAWRIPVAVTSSSGPPVAVLNSHTPAPTLVFWLPPTVPTAYGAKIGPVSAGPEQALGLVDRVDEEPRQHHRSERVQPEFVGGRHAEVAAAPTEAPEQVVVLAFAGGDEPAVGGDDIRREQVVAGQPELGREPTVAATKGETAHTGRRHPAAGGGETEQLGFPVQLAHEHAAVDPSGASLRVDVHPLQTGEIDQDAAVDGAVAGDAVPAAANSERQALLSGVLDRVDDVGGPLRSDNERWTLVDRPIPHRPCVVVAEIARSDHLTLEALPELGGRLDGRLLRHSPSSSVPRMSRTLGAGAAASIRETTGFPAPWLTP